MNRLIRKCKNNVGASMIIALVFLLFCIFVSGSVLTAATVNGYRIEHMSDQQDYLNQRSAALLMADQLKTSDGSPLTMNVEDYNVVAYRIRVNEDGSFDKVNADGSDPGDPAAVVPYSINRTIKFSFAKNRMETPLQRMLYESAVAQYISQYANGARITPVIQETAYQSDLLNDITYFWNVQNVSNHTYELSWENDVTVEAKTAPGGGGTPFTQFDAHLKCSDGSVEDSDLYDLDIDFGTDSQLKVHLAASEGKYDYPHLTKIGKDAATSVDLLFEIDSSKTAVSWAGPIVSKGGA